MRAFSRLTGAWLLLAASTLAQPAAPASPGPERLPADTWVMINWHGVAAATRVRATNPVMRLWNDPQFASARDRFLEAMGQDMSRWARANIDDVLAVLENPVVIGVAGDPFATATSAASGPGQMHAFGVVNRKGKEAEWARLRKDQQPAANATVSTYAFRGVQVRKSVTSVPPTPSPQGTAQDGQASPRIRETLEASLGDYELFADHQGTMESLITRLQEKNPAGASLRDDAAYQKAQRFRAEGPLLEMFVKVPDVARLVPVPATPQIDLAAGLRALHLERIQGLWLSAGMGREQMLVRGALLGDLTPGSVLDVIGSNVTEFKTLAVSPLTGSYGALRLDLPALHAALLRAVKAGLPADQGAAANMMVDGLVAAQLGIPLTQLLGLFDGEFAMASTGGEQLAQGLPNLVMIPLTSSEPVLQMLRTLARPLIQGEETVAGATVLRMGAATPGQQAIYVAVAAKMLVVSPARSQVEDLLARGATGTTVPAGTLAADATFRSARKLLPAELNGISYTDVSRVEWDQQLETMRRNFAKQKQETLAQAASAEKGDERNPPDPARADTLRKKAASIDETQKAFDAVFPLLRKHLKVSAGGSWKAGDGWYFHSFVN